MWDNFETAHVILSYEMTSVSHSIQSYFFFPFYSELLFFPILFRATFPHLLYRLVYIIFTLSYSSHSINRRSLFRSFQLYIRDQTNMKLSMNVMVMLLVVLMITVSMNNMVDAGCCNLGDSHCCCRDWRAQQIHVKYRGLHKSRHGLECGGCQWGWQC